MVLPLLANKSDEWRGVERPLGQLGNAAAEQQSVSVTAGFLR